MRKILSAVIVFAALAATAEAQGRFYVAGNAAAEIGARGPVDVGAVGAAGGLVGVRLGRGWSIEAGFDRGWGDGEPRVFEGLLLSFIDVPSTPEERERMGVFGRSEHSSSTRKGYSAVVVWSPKTPGRMQGAAYGGLAWRDYERRHLTTITGAGPGVDVVRHAASLRDSDERRITTGGGLTAGVMFPIRVRGRFTIAPELRTVIGVITDDSAYRILHTGVRLMWGY